jgi:hypothetical protein
MEVMLRNVATLNINGKSIWRCKYCLKKYLESGGTTVITNHLEDQHNIDGAQRFC